MDTEPVYRPVAIPLNEQFDYVHATHGETTKDDLYVGRKRLIGKIVSLLESTGRIRGSYLITGYRGVGKTSVINKALAQYTEKTREKKPLIVRINLGDNSQLTPWNIYFSIANILLEEIQNEKKPFVKDFLRERSIPEPILTALLKLPLTVHPNFRVLSGIERETGELIERMGNEISETRSISLESGVGTGRNSPLQSRLKGSHGSSKYRKALPIHTREVEDRLLRILRRLGDSKIFKVIFVLDEIDKLSDHEELSDVIHYDATDAVQVNKTTRINTLLGSLKNFITTAHATFFFISGRETLDRYHSEKGNPNSLYESLFDQVFEVPSFLTDEGERPRGTQLSLLIEEYVCRRINIQNKEYSLKTYHGEILADLENAHQDKVPGNPEMDCGKEARFFISTLRSFIHFLTFHSWGNPKRLNSIFESFIVPWESISDGTDRFRMPCGPRQENNEHRPKYVLVFTNSNKRSFALASEITTLFQHQLSREVSRISDKLTVSVFSSLHFILKLHSYGFSRETLHRMSEAINIYRSPELNTIVDDLLTHVFKPYIRRIRNGMYRFCFHSSFEQELLYVSHISELESASYNFSLNSMAQVKNFFKNLLAGTNSEELNVISTANIILGDMSAIEQSYSVASVHYIIAARILRKTLYENAHPNRAVFMSYVELLLKQGDLSEHRHNYARAAALYSEAQNVVNEYVKVFGLLDVLRKGDSKWDLLKQPYWAYEYLSLKRSPPPFKQGRGMPPFPSHLYRWDDPRYYNYAAGLYLFRGDVKAAVVAYSKTLDLTMNASLEERSSFLRNQAKVGIIESTLICNARELHAQLAQPANCFHFGDWILGKSLETRDTESSSLGDHLGKMKATIENYEKNRLYTSAVITSIKTILYFTTILDAFDENSFTAYPQKRKQLEDLIREVRTSFGKVRPIAVRCIDKARQLESTQGIKTSMVYDLKNVTEPKDYTGLIDWVSSPDPDQHYPENESIFWQQSLWTHKLAAALLWFNFVQCKILGDEITPSINRFPELISISVKSAILVRWIYARHTLHSSFDKEVVKETELGNIDVNTIDIGSVMSRKTLTLTDSGKELIGYIYATQDHVKDQIPLLFRKIYEISRYLYFATHQSRVISRKNLDLVFPRLSQVYYIQWKLLKNVLVLALLWLRDNSQDQGRYRSIRDIAFQLQRKLIDHDEEQAQLERIPPSYFDYEYIYLRLEESLDSSINLIDRTSRSQMSIFHHKYFCHDDHHDQEFRMDYTLAYLFAPSAHCIRELVNCTHDKIHGVINEIQENLRSQSREDSHHP